MCRSLRYWRAMDTTLYAMKAETAMLAYARYSRLMVALEPTRNRFVYEKVESWDYEVWIRGGNSVSGHTWEGGKKKV